jgi:TRAP transporter TAXI family solute receptor
MKILRYVAAVAAALMVAPSQPWAQTVGIGTNPQGTIFYNAAAAVGKLMNDEMKIKARIQAYSGSTTFSPLIDKDEVQFGLINAGDADNAWRGAGDYAGHPLKHLRLLAVLFPLRQSCAVPMDSKVKTLADIKGLRMPSNFIAMKNYPRVVNAILASVGLSDKDLKAYPVANAFQGFDALGTGKVDVACIGIGLPAIRKVNLELKDHGGIRFLSIGNSPEGVAAMKKVLPSRPILVKPSSSLVGVVEPTWFMANNIFIATNDKVSDDLAYRLVKTIHQNKAKLAKIMPQFNLLDPNDMYQAHTMPYQAGALRYYKEIGQQAK